MSDLDFDRTKASASQSDGLIDARLLLPAQAYSLWDRATSERDRVAAVLEQTIRASLLVWVRKSKPGEYPLCCSLAPC